MNYTSGQPSNLSKDQRVYTWNGTQHCTLCHQITENGQCPQDCHRQNLPTPKEQNQVWASLGFDEQGIRYCDDCHEVIRGGQDAFTRFEFSDGRIDKVVCSSCSSIRLDKDIAQGKFLYSLETDSWFSPRQFPDKTGYKIGDLLPPDC